MMKDNIIVIFSSHLSEEENNKFIKHINNTISVAHKVVCYPNFNQYSLSEIYNKAIVDHNNDNAIMVFCHNDIIFKTSHWGRLLLNKFNNSDYQILGVAGSTFLGESGKWWTDPTKMVGIVEHCDGNKTWVSEYSKERRGHITPVVLVDGLFIAADCNDLEHSWDEDFKGFHMYDVSFCFENYIDGVNIGVTTDIRILHKSIGMTNQEWENNRIQFAEKYKDDLPIIETTLDGFKNEEVLVNVITRTHDREKYFKVCRESVLNQYHENINHIVGSDVKCDYYDCIDLKLQDVVYPKPDIGIVNVYEAPWNLHLNELNKHVKDGWIMYLDDDDKFVFPNSIRIIVNNIDNEDQILLWRVDINGYIVPSDENFGKIIPGNISGIGFMFHSKHLPVNWGSWSYGDYRVLSQLTKKLKQKWIYLTLTQTQGMPNNGKSPKD